MHYNLLQVALFFAPSNDKNIDFMGKITMEESVNQAINIGLKQLAITDHAFNHCHGINKKDFFNHRKVISIQKCNSLYTNIIFLTKKSFINIAFLSLNH